MSELARLDMLIAARLRGKGSPGDIVRALARYAPPEATPADWRAVVEPRVAVLVDAAARARVPALPDAPWAQLVGKLLPGLVLGVAAGDGRAFAALAKDDGWAAAVVARARGIWTDGAPPSLLALGHALVWQHLGLPGRPPSRGIVAGILSAMLQQVMPGPTGTPQRIVRTEAARLVHAARGDARTIRDALIKLWLAGRAQAPATPADRLCSTARGPHGEAVLGDRKVFIAAIWDLLRRDPEFAMSLDDFKAHLLDAHRAGTLELARADYTRAMDPGLVQRSETTWDGASFHFVVRQDGARP